MQEEEDERSAHTLACPCSGKAVRGVGEASPVSSGQVAVSVLLARREARKMLAEAVTLYLETCFESNSPYLRPVPAEEDPRRNPPENLVEIFPVEVTCRIYPLN
jgi:hypothetical protein